MTSLITAMLFASSINVAEAHNGHRHTARRNRPAARHYAHPRPAPPPRVTQGHTVTHHRGYWTYPHSNARFVWKWRHGHYTARGVWVPGSWRVVVRF